MDKEFDVHEILSLPENIIRKHIDNFWVILASDYPNWIVLDADEIQMFSALEKKMTIIQAIDNFIANNTADEDFAIAVMTGLLSKIEETQFYKDTKSFEEEKIENFPKLLHVNLTNNCNLRCLHCYMSAGKFAEQTINFEKLKNFLNEVRKLQGDSEIILSGGEPLTYKDFFKVLDCADEGNNKIVLFTNGTLINEKNYKSICEHCDEIQLSFEGITEKYFDLVRGKGNYRKVMRAFKLLKSANVRIILAITLLPVTIEDVKNNLIEFIRSLDYKNIEIRLNHEIEITGNAKSMDMSKYNREYFNAIVIELMKELEKIGVQINFSETRNVKYSNCGIGANLIVHYDENIYPCHKIDNIYFKMGDSVKKIFEAFNEINKNTSNFLIKKCRDCEIKCICAGGCRIDNLKKNGDMLQPLCDENFKTNVYRRLLFEYLRG